MTGNEVMEERKRLAKVALRANRENMDRAEIIAATIDVMSEKQKQAVITARDSGDGEFYALAEGRKGLISLAVAYGLSSTMPGRGYTLTALGVSVRGELLRCGIEAPEPERTLREPGYYWIRYRGAWCVGFLRIDPVYPPEMGRGESWSVSLGAASAWSPGSFTSLGALPDSNVGPRIEPPGE